MNRQYTLEQIKNWRLIGRGMPTGTLVVYMPEKNENSLLTTGKMYLWDGEIAGIRGASTIVDNRGHKFWGIPTKDFRLVPQEIIVELSRDFS